MIKIYFLLVFFLIVSTSYLCPCVNLKKGSFAIYENGIKVGHIYRKQNLQIEKYLDSTEDIVTSIKSEGCLFYMKSYHITEDLDTITWAVTYEEIGNNHYSYVGKPRYLEVDYNHHGEIKKISNKIEKDILDIFKMFESEQ